MEKSKNMILRVNPASHLAHNSNVRGILNFQNFSPQYFLERNTSVNIFEGQAKIKEEVVGRG